MPKSPEQLSQLEKFHLEISELKGEEERGGQSVHLRDISPQNLTEEDMLIYRKFKDSTLELSEFKEYRDNVCGGVKYKDSCDFAAFLGNQARYWDSRMSK